jgi:hypothetical protein
MMGHREKLRGGDEWDYFHRYSRSILRWTQGEGKRIKALFSRRVRREAKKDARACASTVPDA